jgi:hypothetical protein
MVDYATILIAAISAGAGLGGSIIAGYLSLKAVRLSHRREDSALVRSKVEELFAELDRVQALSHILSARALKEMNAETPSQDQFEQINLGKIRSIAGMYFPECKTAIASFDAEYAKVYKEVRELFKNHPPDLMKKSYGLISLEFGFMAKMCRDIRGILERNAEIIGASILN